MIDIRFLLAAELELVHEVEYYSAARTGTGVRFQAEVEAAANLTWHSDILKAARHLQVGHVAC